MPRLRAKIPPKNPAPNPQASSSTRDASPTLYDEPEQNAISDTETEFCIIVKGTLEIDGKPVPKPVSIDDNSDCSFVCRPEKDQSISTWDITVDSYQAWKAVRKSVSKNDCGISDGARVAVARRGKVVTSVKPAPRDASSKQNTDLGRFTEFYTIVEKSFMIDGKPAPDPVDRISVGSQCSFVCRPKGELSARFDLTVGTLQVWLAVMEYNFEDEYKIREGARVGVLWRREDDEIESVHPASRVAFDTEIGDSAPFELYCNIIEGSIRIDGEVVSAPVGVSDQSNCSFWARQEHSQLARWDLRVSGDVAMRALTRHNGKILDGARVLVGRRCGGDNAILSVVPEPKKSPVPKP